MAKSRTGTSRNSDVAKRLESAIWLLVAAVIFTLTLLPALSA